MANIFISYAREDRDQAAAVAKALGRLGWQVFWDRDIPPGKTWDEVIEGAIEAAGCMLVLWSRNSVASEWVRAEAEEGLQRKILIPVLIEEAKIPLRFRPLQAASLIDWREDPSHLGFKQSVQAIAEIIGSPPRDKQDATKSEAGVIAEPPNTALPKLKPAEAPKAKAKTAKPEPSEPQPETAKSTGKSISSKIVILIALAVVVVVGAIMLFRQEQTRSGTEFSAPQVTVAEPQKAPEPAAKAPKAEPRVAAKMSESSPAKKFNNSIGMEFVLIPAGSFTMGCDNGYDNEKISA